MRKQLSLLLSSLGFATGLASLTVSLLVPGPIGPQGPSGNDGSQGNSGENGLPGDSGASGADGHTPYIGENGNWWINGEDTNIDASGSNANFDYLPQVNITPTEKEIELMSPEAGPNITTEQSKQIYVNNLIANEGYTGISTPAELMAINNPEGKYVLLNSLNFFNLVAPSWSPINFYDQTDKIPFSGILDGAGYSISGIVYASIDETQPYEYYGLFDELDGATIQNLFISNFYFQRTDNGNMGLLAGLARSSTFKNIDFTANTLSGNGDYIGAIAGRLMDSSVSLTRIQSLVVFGNNYLGGISGEADDSFFSNLSLLDINIDGKYTRHGGAVGSSSRNTYVEIQSEIIIELGGSSEANNRLNIGGLIGESYDDRLLFIQTTGSMEFAPIDEFYVLINVGGVVGFAANTVFYWVNNDVDVTVYYEPPIVNVTIQSIGGVIGASEFVALNQVANLGNVTLTFDREMLDDNIYLDAEEHPIEYLGGVIGYVYGSASLYQVINQGMIQGLVDVGGIIGSTGIPLWFFQQFIYMNEIANLGKVGGALHVGGMMGLNDQFTNMIALNMMNVEQITGENYVGGLYGIISPNFTIKVTIKNAYNLGEVVVEDYIGGGLIGAVVPLNFDFIFPSLGEIHLYHSFNIGLLTAENLGFVESDFDILAVGGIIGSRQILTICYDVSYLFQMSPAEIILYNNDTGNYDATGIMMEAKLPGVANGSHIDLNLVEDENVFVNPETFRYRNVWDMDTVWTYVPLGDIYVPALQMLLG